jgi:outer membrane protein assembly factor BamE (lipoprotein component of BamABCDE complex)
MGKASKKIFPELSGRLGGWPPLLSRAALLLGVLALALVFGAWRDVSGNTINPDYVSRIKDGQTSKHEIILLFGDPQEVVRTPEGRIFKYISYKDAPQFSSKLERQVDEQAATPFFLDEDKKIKRVPLKKAGKILKSTLIIRFKPDGNTVLSHEYKEY